MKITPSKRFCQLDEVISACRKAAINDEWEKLSKLRHWKFDSLLTAVTKDFERLSQEYDAVADKVAAFRQAKKEIQDLRDASRRRIREKFRRS